VEVEVDLAVEAAAVVEVTLVVVALDDNVYL
jgi:hypothetical protein